MTLKIKINDVEELDKNWQTMYLCQPACVGKNNASRISSFFVVYNCTFRGRRTDERTHILPAYTPFRRNGVKTKFDKFIELKMTLPHFVEDK